MSEETGPDFGPGYVSGAVAADSAPSMAGKPILHGPPAMVDAAGPMLIKRGLCATDVHVHVFYTPDHGERPTVTHP
jgi:ferredoxin-NAD(P)+ reductase (naphthalene dioxygenase ferredoxin-specific)